ncbi:hypothetical protein NVP1009O_22 [Vibrio phage 1.009.O._10N.261.51.C9]|nr:hypothetical protein NVP1009O_22 [Vibrio phage 1.009.O._10N.261.51.C9]
MAINPRDETAFDNKIDETDLVNYPYGKPRNITTPGDGTGTPWEQLGIREIWGFQQALLTAAGITPNGNSETAQSSQYLDAVRAITAAQPGQAKAWVNFETRATGAPVVRSSFNVSSIGDLAVGRHQVNFATAMASVNYSFVGSSIDSGTGFSYTSGRETVTASSFVFSTLNTAGVETDATDINAVVFSN